MSPQTIVQPSIFGTRTAAAYLSAHGVRRSPSYLEKARLRGDEDPRDRGPDYERDPQGICWYTRDALDRYIAARLAERAFRARAEQPENFRRD